MHRTDQPKPSFGVPGVAAMAVGLGLLAGGVGCQSGPQLATIDLTQAHWVVRQGQAVWEMPDRDLELVGDLLVATRPGGGGYVRFSKPPFPLVEAQVSEAGWRIQFNVQDKTRAGRRSPPLRLVWFELLHCQGQTGPSQGWIYTPSPSGEWRLENRITGECLQGFFRVTSRPHEHGVEAGDSLEWIAAYYGVSVSQLRALNPGLEVAPPRPGERVQLPPVVDAP